MRVVILLLGILALSAFVGCQSKPMVVSESGSGSEGIKVHGDWTVEVRNPDGSLAVKRQFANKFIGQQLVAGLLSLDIDYPSNVDISRFMNWKISDSPNSGSATSEAECKGASDIQNSNKLSIFPYPKLKTQVLATAVHAPNAEGNMYNSVWNGSCTLEINGDEPKYLFGVSTSLYTYPAIYKNFEENLNSFLLSRKFLDESIEVWDGQVIAATVILSVD
jgi:hypothetical protein